MPFFMVISFEDLADGQGCDYCKIAAVHHELSLRLVVDVRRKVVCLDFLAIKNKIANNRIFNIYLISVLN